MKRECCVGLAGVLLFSGFTCAAPAQTLLSVSSAGISNGITGGGGSWGPVMTPDGGQIAFMSSAMNLALLTNGLPPRQSFFGNLNVYSRNRTAESTVMVSVSLDGLSGGNGDSYVKAISTNGQYVLFESSAGNLVAGDTNSCADIFVRDLVEGKTILISTSTNGACGNGESHAAVMTPDGRYVAFSSAANNLVTDDTNGIPDVFVRDLLTQTTRLVSVGAAAAGIVYGGASRSDRPVITPDGTRVAFYSTATNLVPAITTTGDIYVRDLTVGYTYCASTGARGVLYQAQQTSNAVSFAQELSADGSTVAFQVAPTSGSSTLDGIILRFNLNSQVTDLVATNAFTPAFVVDDLANLDLSPDGRYIAFVANTNTAPGGTCVFVWDGQFGTNLLASQNLSNSISPGATCHSPVLAPDGRWVAFLSSSTNLVTNTMTGSYHLYLRDLQTGATRLLDGDSSGAGVPLSPLTLPCVSDNGRYVAFESEYDGVVSNDRNQASDVFLRDTQAGTIETISASLPGIPSLTPNGVSVAEGCGLSADGRVVVFGSDADTVVANDTNNCRDIFLRDLVALTNSLVSLNTNGFCGARASFVPAITASGRFVAFCSRADDLVTNDNNNAQDIFLRDLQTGSTRLVSWNATSTSSANGDSYQPLLSNDGRYVAFRSRAGNLTAISPGGSENLYVRDTQLGTNYAVSVGAGGISNALLSANGRFLVYVAVREFDSTPYLCVWDNTLLRRIYTNTSANLLPALGISSNGNRIAYCTASGIFATDLTANTNVTLSAGHPSALPGLRFSADSRWLVYAKATNNLTQIFLFDFSGGTNSLVSRQYNSASPANGCSDSPDLSSDGRFVAYRSFASDIVPGDANNTADIFAYDRQSDVTMLLSANLDRPASGNHFSRSPMFSSNSSVLMFATWNSDSVAGDFNETRDLVAYRIYNSESIPLFSLQISSATESSARTISWPVVPGKTYRVQFKHSLADTFWQEFSGGIGIVGSQAYFSDPGAPVDVGFYRVIAY